MLDLLNVLKLSSFYGFTSRILLGFDIYTPNTIPAWFLPCNNLQFLFSYHAFEN